MSAEAEDEDVELLRQAQDWEDAMATGDAQVRKDFAQWLRTSPRHVAAYLRAGTVSLELTELDRHGEFDLK